MDLVIWCFWFASHCGELGDEKHSCHLKVLSLERLPQNKPFKTHLFV